MLIDSDTGEIVDANHAATEYYGYSKNELCSMKISQINILSPDEIHQEMRRAAAGKRNHFHFKHKLKDGQIRNVEVHSSPIYNTSRKLLFSIVHDTTDREKAEKRLRESEERYRLLADTTFEATILSLGGTIVDVNEQALHMFGYSFDEIAGMYITDLNGSSGIHFGEADYEKAGERARETWARKADGVEFPVEFRESEVLFREQVLRVTVIRDIIEQKSIQAALERSEKKYRMLINNTNEGFWLVDSNQMTIDVNDSLCSMLQYDRFEIHGKKPGDFVPERMKAVYDNKIREARTTGHRVYELTLVRKDGTEVSVIVHGTSMFDDEGSFQGSFAFITDITRLKETERMVEENFQLLQSVIDAIPAPVFYIDEKQRFFGCNKSFELLTGKNRTEITGLLAGGVLPEAAMELSRYNTEILESGEHVHYEIYLFHEQMGRYRQYVLFKSPYTTGSGHVSGIVSVALDITEQKIIQEQLRILNDHLEERVQEEIHSRVQSEHKYEFLFNTITDAILIHEIDENETAGNLIAANDRSFELLGYTYTELSELKPGSYEKIEGDQSLLEKLPGSLSAEHHPVKDLTLIGKNGNEIPVEVNARRFTLEGKNVVLFSVRDVSERNKLENEKKVQEQMLIQQSKLAEMGEMVGAIAHQWKQPLNNISIMVQDLEEAFEAEEIDLEYVKSFVKHNMEQIQFLITTIDDFRRFFRRDPSQQFFKVETAVQDIVRLLKAQMSNHRILVEIQMEARSNLKVFGNANEFKQVLMNLLNNSREAVEEKRSIEGQSYQPSVVIQIQEPEPGKARIIVSDNGGGIPESVMDKLFHPYITSKGEKGTGIGLYMARNLIERSMGGKIAGENGESGAVFTVDLQSLLPEDP